MKKEIIKNILSLWDEYCLSFNTINADLIEKNKIPGTDFSSVNPTFEHFIEWLRNK